MDGTVTRSVTNEYVGFGRRLRSATKTGSAEDAGSVNTYFYDEGSGEPFHTDVNYVVGRLTHAHSAFDPA